ncbi:MAG: hypothetical protein D6734_06310 [Candidatus Schekmanbacteria bacterium]|nr:MAG: hypothetical protein D6734_06310 [Candidatus Schekmanbacteria bacterium]
MTKKTRFIIAIDIGTTRCKTALFKSSGELVAYASSSSNITFSPDGKVEADADAQWWKPIVKNIKEIFKNKKSALKNLAGIGISCTNALVFIDNNGKPLVPAVMQFDKRTTDLVNSYSKRLNPEELFEITLNRLTVGSSALPTILWFKENARSIYKKTAKFLYPTGYINFKLTGNPSIDISRTGTTLMYDTKGKNWSKELLNYFELDEDKLPPVYNSTDVIGTVNAKASKETGIPEGVPVIAGSMDTFSAVIGLGAEKPNDTVLIPGTVARLCKIISGRGLLKDPFINFEYGKKRFLSIACMDGMGTSYKWYAETFNKKELLQREKNIKKKSAKKETEEAIPPCSDGLIYLPYITGERSPIWDPYAHGVIFGLSPNCKSKNIYQSIIEGCAFAVKMNIEIMSDEAGLKTKSLIVPETGFGSYPEWMQIFADVTGCEIQTLTTNDPECTGTAALTAEGTGAIKDRTSFVKKNIKKGTNYRPDKNRNMAYNSFYILYKKIYDDLRSDFRILNEIRKNLK